MPSANRSRLTPEQRSLRARIAAHARWSKEDPKANAQRGQVGLRARFRREIEAAFPELPERELERRAESAFRAHMAKLAYRSAKVRSRAVATDTQQSSAGGATA